MRDRQEVAEKFWELRSRYLSERKAQFLGKIPRNCSHNITLRVKGNGNLGFCRNPVVLSKCGPQKMFVCNEAATAERCRLFCCRSNEASVENTFNEILASPARCGNDYPKLAMIIWFLQEYEMHSRFSRFNQMAKRAIQAFLGIVTFRWW